MQETLVWSLGWEDPLEKGKATHSSILAWRIPWTTVYGVAKSRRWLSDQNTHDICLSLSDLTLLSMMISSSICVATIGIISWTSLIAQLVKNLPVRQEIPVWFLDWEYPWRWDRLLIPVLLGFAAYFIISWQIEGLKVEVVTDFRSWVLKSLQMVTAGMKSEHVCIFSGKLWQT